MSNILTLFCVSPHFLFLLSFDQYRQLLERQTGKLRAELLHCGQTFHHFCPSGSWHLHVGTRWACWHYQCSLIPYIKNGCFLMNWLKIRIYSLLLCICVQEKLRLCQMHLMAHRHLLEQSDLRFIMGSGRMMDGNCSITITSLYFTLNGMVMVDHALL